MSIIATTLGNRTAAVSRGCIGAFYTGLFTAKAAAFTAITALAYLTRNQKWINSWKVSTKRSYSMAGCSMALTLQGARQFFWYSTALSPKAFLKRDVLYLGRSLGYELFGQENYDKNPFSQNSDIPVRGAFKAAICLYDRPKGVKVS